MDGYRIATSRDISLIFSYLADGRKEEVLVRSLCSAEEPTPLLALCRGPFTSSGDEISGFSPEGEEQALRLAIDGPRYYLELRKGERDWIPPHLGSDVLLVRA